jgi:hypothetical protein
MWFWKALKEDWWFAVYVVATVVAVANFPVYLAWGRSTTFAHVSQVVSILALIVGLGVAIRDRKIRYTSDQ